MANETNRPSWHLRMKLAAGLLDDRMFGHRLELQPNVHPQAKQLGTAKYPYLIQQALTLRDRLHQHGAIDLAVPV